MPEQNKTMDFFRPVRATDPLVSRPAIKSVSTPVQKPRVNSSSVQPTLRSGSGIVTKSKAIVPDLSKSSVSVKKTVIEKTSPTSTVVTSTTATVTSATKVPKPVQKPVETKKPKDDDDWFDSLEKAGFLSEKKPEKTKEGKVSYPFGGESPFLKSVQVEKRPLSNSVREKSPYENPNFGKKAPAPRHDPVRIVNKSKKKSNAISLALIILITIILGAAAGVAVFFLIAK